jgi:hypothetical protein
MTLVRLTKEEYFAKVRMMTDHVKKQIPRNPDTSDLHLDHIIPIIFGYNNNIPPEVLSLPENLQYINKNDNLQKGRLLTERSINILKSWIDACKVDSKLDYFIKQEEEFQIAKTKYDFSEVYKNVKARGIHVVYNLPSDIAYAIIPIDIQRRHDLRWEKTRKALGRVQLPTHRMMICAVYPDGSIERLDGNTRTHIFKNNLQFSDYEAPETWFVTFIAVRDRKHAHEIYHSIDSSDTAETFAEKVSGYMHAKGYHVNLPTQFQKGEKVYDIAVIAIDGYIPTNESDPVSIARTSDLADRANETVKCLDYFIKEFVTLGSLINSESIPRYISSPLMGMMIRYLMVNKTKECEDLIRSIIDYSRSKLSPFARPYHSSALDKNILIMLDELKTPEEIGFVTNHHVPYRNTSSRVILPDYATKTTANTGDRRLYCGWIAYCIDKTLADEAIDEDILLDVTGIKITDESKTSEHTVAKSRASSLLMSKYDNFWKEH